MQVQTNTDKNIPGGDRLSQYVKSSLDSKLSRFSEHLTRVEAHLSDESGQKPGSANKKCVMEARPRGMQPLAVTHSADTLDHAISGAVEKLERLLDSTFGQLSSHKGRTRLADSDLPG